MLSSLGLRAPHIPVTLILAAASQLSHQLDHLTLVLQRSVHDLSSIYTHSFGGLIQFLLYSEDSKKILTVV